MSFSLTYSCMGGAPFSGGTSRLSVSNRAGKYLIIDELVGEGPEYRRSGQVPTLQRWRGVAAYLKASRIVAYDTDGDTGSEYPFPHLMVLKGRSSLATDMVAMAWTGDPVLQLMQAIARHPDEEIERLRERYGSLRSEAFVTDLMRFRHWAEELLVDPDDIIARGPRFGWDFRLMRKDVIALARVSAAEDTASKLRQKWSLSPYEAQITAMVAAWRRANPASSGNTQMGVGIRSGMLQRYITSYVLQHGAIPKGKHHIKNDNPNYRGVDFDVDMDDLWQGPWCAG